MFTSGEAPDDVVEKYLLGLLRTATQGGNMNAPPDPGHVGESAERMRVMLFKVAETIGNDSEYFASDRMLVRLGLSLVAMIKRESGPAAQVDIRAAADRAVTNALQTAQRRTEAGWAGWRPGGGGAAIAPSPSRVNTPPGITCLSRNIVAVNEMSMPERRAKNPHALGAWSRLLAYGLGNLSLCVPDTLCIAPW